MRDAVFLRGVRMSTYIVHAIGVEHEITAHTYTLGSEGLKFIGSDGVTVAIFITFDWLKLVQSAS